MTTRRRCSFLVLPLTFAFFALACRADAAGTQVVFDAGTSSTFAVASSTVMPTANTSALDPYAAYHVEVAERASAEAARHDVDPLTALEDRFLSVPSRSSARDALKRYTAQPHPAGSQGSYDFAVRLLREWGDALGAEVPEDVSTRVFQAGTRQSREEMTRGCSSDGEARPRVWIDTYKTFITVPIRAGLTLSRPGEAETYWTADLREGVLTDGPASTVNAPPYHAFSAPGRVSGPLVYAGTGSREDFERLAKLGVDVRGAIVLIRYGRTYRGKKVSEAHRAGAVGVLIYSDPIEDGDCTVQKGHKPYPDGPARHPTSIQRGSVRTSGSPGDPTTPGWPSYPGKQTKRLPLEEADLPRIPSLPISYANAAKLFEILHGNGPTSAQVGRGWKGNIPDVEEYHLGPSQDIVTLENIVELELKPMYNTYACVPGHVSNETIFLGNHRDAWTAGAADPGSGTVVVSEIVKSIGALVKPTNSSSDSPFRPLRQIMIASWDGEEFGLAGSTEYGEDFSEWLQENVAVYHNIDIAVQGGWLSLGAVPSLIDVFQRSAQRLPDLRNMSDDETLSEGADHEPLAQNRSLEIRRTSPLGSGSDYTVFLAHNGIASSMPAYRRRRDDPAYMYHSVFDSFHWMETYGDPHFRRHESMAKLLGLVVLRSATELALPLRVDHYAVELGRYLVQIERALGERRTKSAVLPHGGDEVRRRAIDRVRGAVEGVKRAATALEHVRRSALADLRRTAVAVGDDEALTSATSTALQRLRTANALVARFENGFLARSPSSQPTTLRNMGGLEGETKPKPGLASRPWFRHLIVAPSRQSGYGAVPFPGLMEALTTDEAEDGHQIPRAKADELVAEEAQRIVEVLEALSARIEAGLRGLGIDLEEEVAVALAEAAREGTGLARARV